MGWSIFTDKPHAEKLFHLLQERILSAFEDISVKQMGNNPFAYFRERMFACVWIQRTRQRPEGYLDVSFCLPREIESPRILDKLESHAPGITKWEYWVTVTDAEGIDEELMGWLGESYALSTGKKAVYELKYWFEWWSGEIWGANDEAREKYGYPVDLDDLPLPAELKERILGLSDEHGDSLDPDYPPDPTPWTAEHIRDFEHRAKVAYEQIKAELGETFEIIYDVNPIN